MSAASDRVAESATATLSQKIQTAGVLRSRWPLTAGVWAIPASIAISESLLSVAALLRIFRLLRRQASFVWPRCLWFWLAWAVLETLVWATSPDPAAGWSEIRHLLLLAVLFVTLPDLDTVSLRMHAWRGVFVVASLSSIVLIIGFFVRLITHAQAIAAGGDANFYLRAGGLVHHWMVYATIEVVVVAGLIAYWSFYPEERRRWWPVAALNAVAIVLSLTRMLWLSVIAMLVIHLLRRRSRWLAVLPLAALAVYLLSPEAVQTRIRRMADLTYYSNAERVQMLEVGWQMVQDYPWTGVGPGGVERLYTTYLDADDYVPAYHHHLHNNLAHLAAEFGIPVALAAVLFVGVLFRDVWKAGRNLQTREERFVAEAALLALSGFVLAGLFEYTYGHALGLIMITFAVLPALIPTSR